MVDTGLPPVSLTGFEQFGSFHSFHMSSVFDNEKHGGIIVENPDDWICKATLFFPPARIDTRMQSVYARAALIGGRRASQLAAHPRSPQQVPYTLLENALLDPERPRVLRMVPSTNVTLPVGTMVTLPPLLGLRARGRDTMTISLSATLIIDEYIFAIVATTDHVQE